MSSASHAFWPLKFPVRYNGDAYCTGTITEGMPANFIVYALFHSGILASCFLALRCADATASVVSAGTASPEKKCFAFAIVSPSSRRVEDSCFLQEMKKRKGQKKKNEKRVRFFITAVLKMKKLFFHLAVFDPAECHFRQPEV